MADGTIAKAKIDFEVLKEISRISRQEYRVAGSVQHGASTLPEEVFDQFPNNDTVEIHLATGFQNTILDHPQFPPEMKKGMIDWCRETSADEKKKDETDEQFIYKTRKKALGPFKQRMWEMPGERKDAIVASLEAKFSFLFEKLSVTGTRDLVSRYVPTGRGIRRMAVKQASGAMAFVNEGEGE